jgi:N-acetylglucosaminyldiphosphoundecaprenol N-acetyl-beta-D-mannosaminyltransferase
MPQSVGHPCRLLPGASVLGAHINALSWDEAFAVLQGWAQAAESRYVCISNVHMIVTARDDASLAKAMHEADMCTPDGAPVAWMLRRLGFEGQPRLSGTEVMLGYLKLAAARGESAFLLGGTDANLENLVRRLGEIVPGIKIAGAYSPPFRELTAEEDAEIVARINASGARTVWVGLGCPKQEKWMFSHRGRVHAVMLGVGAAFDFVSGAKPRAPVWMQRLGLEWLHRLASEPGRLWRRYLVTNTVFMFGAAWQLLSQRR